MQIVEKLKQENQILQTKIKQIEANYENNVKFQAL
jgi:hypothetical protein